MKSTEMIQKLVDQYNHNDKPYFNHELLYLYPLMKGIQTVVVAINELTDVIAKKGLEATNS